MEPRPGRPEFGPPQALLCSIDPQQYARFAVMWFRRKNKPDSDHSVLSSTLVSLQGLLDERPMPGEPKSVRQEPKLPAVEPGANTPAKDQTPTQKAQAIDPPNGSAQDDTRPVSNSKKTVDSPEPAVSETSQTTKQPGSSWANLDLHFDEVESTVVMPVASEEPVNAEEQTEPEEVEEIEAAPAPDTGSELDETSDAVTEQTDADASASNDTDQDTSSTLFDVIPTLNEVVFDPHTQSEADAASDPSAIATEVMQEDFAEPEAEVMGLEQEVVSTVDPEAEEPAAAVIVPGVQQTQPAPPALETPQAPESETVQIPLPTVPLAPSEFTEYLLERLEIAYFEHLEGGMPAPFRDATRDLLLDSIQDWIAQARQVLQRK